MHIDLSTGTTDFVEDPFGTMDTDWEVVSSPDGTTGQAISIEPITWWVTAPSANWIDPYGTGGPSHSDPVGEYVYEVDFEIPDTWTDGQCELRVHGWSADDEATLELVGPNGTTMLDQASPPPPVNFQTHGPVIQPVGPGQYTLRATVSNVSLITGVMMEADVFCDCDLPVDESCALSIQKNFTGDTVTYGGTAEFEMLVCNDGDGECTDPVTVVDDLPPGTTLASHSGNGWSCTANSASVTCEHSNPDGLGTGDCLPPLTLTLDVGDPAVVGNSIQNCANVPDSNPDDPDVRDCATVPVEEPPGACDLEITKSHDGDLVAPGDTTEFEIAVCNVGDGTCDTPVSVVDALPSSLTFVSASGAGWTYTENGGTVSCHHANNNSLAAGECLPTLTLDVELGSAEEVGDAVTNCARLITDDGNETNDRDCATIPVDTAPDEEVCDLAISKTHLGETVVEGSSTTFEIEVCNAGPGSCEDPVTVVDSLPTGVTVDAVTGSGWSSTLSSGSLICTHANAGGLAAADCLPTLTLEVTVGAIERTGDVLRNCARIEGEDVNAENDRDCVTVPVEPREGDCDLQVRKRIAEDVVYAEGAATFEIEVCNVGSGLCTGPVTIVDDLPAGVRFEAASGTGWSVAQSGASLICTHPATGGLVPGACLPGLSIEVLLGSMADVGDQLRNCVRIDGADVNAENDRDCVTVPIEPPVTD